MESSEKPRTTKIVFANGDTEELLVTSEGSNLQSVP